MGVGRGRLSPGGLLSHLQHAPHKNDKRGQGPFKWGSCYPVGAWCSPVVRTGLLAPAR